MPPDTSALCNLNSLISIFSSYYPPFKDGPRITDSEVIGLRERYRDNNAVSIVFFFFTLLSLSFFSHSFTHTLSLSLFKFVSMRSSCVSPKDFKATAPESKQHPAVYARKNHSHHVASEKIIRNLQEESSSKYNILI